MDRALLCQIVEAAFRAGVKNGFERQAVHVQGLQVVGGAVRRPLAEALAGVDAEPVDCYTVIARDVRLCRLMREAEKGIK